MPCVTRSRSKALQFLPMAAAPRIDPATRCFRSCPRCSKHCARVMLPAVATKVSSAAPATLISNDLFITAGHCFDQTGGGWERPRVNGTANIISSAQIAQAMHVNFNYQVDPSGNPRPVSVFPITQLIEYRLGGLDFAIVR